jgi:G3E family GTPase
VLATGLFDAAGKPAEVRQWLQAEAIEEGERRRHGHGHRASSRHGHGHHHDVNRHDASIRAFCLTSDDRSAADRLEMFLDLLRATHGPKLLRLKGAGRAGRRPRAACGPARRPARAACPGGAAGLADQDRRSRLVFIVRDLDKAVVERLWDAFLGRVRIDEPDAAALADNPLALPWDAERCPTRRQPARNGS